MGICISKVEELMKSRNWRPSELARRMGVSKSEVTRLLRGERQGGAKIVTGLKRAFPEVPLESLFYLPSMSPIVNTKVNYITKEVLNTNSDEIPIKHPGSHQLACTLNANKGMIKIQRGKNLTILSFPPGHVTVKHTKIKKQ